ncbi:cardiolipin synthase [Alkaliphilus transvaalensis]|uniref:cardiolipin synthase n=1 Tax=Alkaliphilus transvaalensis TaxID=114628 RepID=UPI00047EECEB|nr:cardiolipin synthase [Alkaliphilus transvaalensis]
MKFLKKFLFHRSIFVAVAILLQLFVLIAVILRFNNYFVFFYGGSIVISIVAVLGIINNQMNPAYKLAWIIPILLFPIFGGLFYLFFGGRKLSRRAKEKMRSIGEKTRKELPIKDDLIEEIKAKNETAANQSRYIQNYAFYPPFKNSTSEYLSIGEMKYEKLKEELRKAEKYIFLEYFIIEEGEMWNSILDILVEKAAAGLDVRIIYDDVGCLFTLPYGYNKKLEKMGIKCSVFNPLIPILSPKLNNRNHRKITIIDGHTGFTGGINLADEYINRLEKYGHWKDSAVMIKGEAVWSMTVMFLSMWGYLRGIKEDFDQYKFDFSQLDIQFNDGDGYIQPFADSPLDGETVGEIVYLNLINKAQKYVYITTPYLIIDNEMVTALTSAAKGGVDIRIITPHLPDKWYVHSVTKSYYRILIESGVKIYEYLPGFIHSKTYVSDDDYGVVGTINMDYRSLHLHFECGVWMYHNRAIMEMKKDFHKTLEICKEITLDEVNGVSWYRSLGRSILRVFAPLM